MVTPPPIPEPKPVALTPEQERGRLILAVALGFWLNAEFWPGVIVLADNIQTLPSFCVKFALTLGLVYAVWIGQNWARWLTALLSVGAFLLALLSFVFSSSTFLLLLTLFCLALCLGSVFVFLVSNPVDAFLSYQRSRR